MVIAPDGKIAYVTSFNGVDSINLVTGSVDTLAAMQSASSIAITPSGKTAYVAVNDAVIPLDLATRALGTPITGPGYRSGNYRDQPGRAHGMRDERPRRLRLCHPHRPRLWFDPPAHLDTRRPDLLLRNRAQRAHSLPSHHPGWPLGTHRDFLQPRLWRHHQVIQPPVGHRTQPRHLAVTSPLIQRGPDTWLRHAHRANPAASSWPREHRLERMRQPVQIHRPRRAGARTGAFAWRRCP
jgi:hypothetical protein